MRDILMRARPHCGQLQHSHTGYIQFLPQPITTPVLQLLKSEASSLFSLFNQTYLLHNSQGNETGVLTYSWEGGPA